MPSAAPRSIRVSAAVGRLAAVRGFVRSNARKLGASEDAVVDLVQAVDEAVTNVIVHGYEGRDGTVDVAVERRGPNIVVTVEDACPRFDPTAVPEPDMSIPAEDRKPGGMGVHLIRAAIDDFEHRPRDPEGNVLTLVRTLRARGAEEA